MLRFLITLGLFHHLLAIHVDGASGHTFLSSREIIIHELALFADGVLFDTCIGFCQSYFFAMFTISAACLHSI